MKRFTVLICFMILIFVASMGIGYFYLNSKEEKKKESKKENIIIENTVEDEIVYTESKDEKISPNTLITKVTLYKMCGHEIVESSLPEEDTINFKEDQIKLKYKDFDLETFTTNNVLLYKEVDQTCNNHFFLGEENGQINIYKLNNKGEEELYETTNILVNYFPKEEQEKIKNKKEIIGKEELYRILENFES